MSNTGIDMQKPNLGAERGAEFKLERYKYILKEIRFLNENVHKYLSLFQALATAVVGGAAAVFVVGRKVGIDPKITTITIRALLALLAVLALFVVLSVLAGIFSWFDYRREEVALVNEVVGPGFRNPPRARNFWRWSETYVVVLMLIIVVAAYLFVEQVIVPAIK